MSNRTLIITPAYLDLKDACSTQLERFEGIFPDGATVTEALALQHAQVFEWSWAIFCLLDEGAVREEAKKEVDAAEELYRKTIMPTYDLHLKDFSDEVRRWAFRRLCKTAQENHNEEMARIFARHFIKQGGRPVMEGEGL